MAFVDFLGIRWHENSWELLKASIKGVQTFRDQLIKRGACPHSSKGIRGKQGIRGMDSTKSRESRKARNEELGEKERCTG